MAQTKRKRRRKHRGTQGGRVDTRPKGRPRNRAEARQRAQARRSGSSPRQARGSGDPSPPTWRSAFNKGLIAAVIFFALLAILFSRPIAASAGIAAFMLAFYVPMAYYTDRFFFNRALRRRQQEQQARAQGRAE
ncbi:MAG TPA: hypothetical protein VHH72_10700 [Solirubrobacterales bacterium]|nr:hypothetical protein [Solirubrobacterales bacterium]